jgi:FMN phosphatase YigB (HAD superfamily)
MPDDCMYVGNSPANDVAPAKQLGFRTVLYAPERVLESPCEPDLIIHNLGQLLEWL